MTDCLRRITIKSCNDWNQSSTRHPEKSQSDDLPPGIPICKWPSELFRDSAPNPIDDEENIHTEKPTNTTAPESSETPHDEAMDNEAISPKSEATITTASCVTCEDNYRDLYCLGLVWIGVIKSAIFGLNLKTTVDSLPVVMPVVEAKNKEEKAPQKPEEMKYKELPLYETPHFEYKDYIEKSKKCKDYDVKMLHELMKPTVSSYRKSIQDTYKETLCGLCCTYKEINTDFQCAIQDVKQYFRDPCRREMRQGIVVTTSLIGYLLARKKLLSRKIIYTSIGAMAGGFLCFPEATDEVVRTCFYHVGKATVCAYSCLANKNWNFRERVPCVEDLPEKQKEKKC